MNREQLRQMVAEQYAAQTCTLAEYLQLGHSAERYAQDLATFCAEGRPASERAIIGAEAYRLIFDELRELQPEVGRG